MLHYSQYPHCLVCLEAMHIAHCACFKSLLNSRLCTLHTEKWLVWSVCNLLTREEVLSPPSPTMAAAASLLAARNRGEENCPCPAVGEMQNTKYLQIQSLHTKYKVRLQNLNTKYKFLAARIRGRERRIVPAWQSWTLHSQIQN